MQRTMTGRDQCHILDINDDCFYHLYKFLPIIDWCSLRDTCTRFRTISDYSFERQSEKFKLRNVSDSYGLDVSEVKCAVRNFGSFMKTLSINQKHFVRHDDYADDVFMLFVDRYCRSLRDLKLSNCNLTLTTIGQCWRLFRSLQRLTVDGWDDDEEAFSKCLAKCVSLTDLELVRVTNIVGGSLAHIRMESLESFKMSCCDDFSYGAVKSFLTINRQLTQVKLFDLRFRDGQDPSYSILEDIGKKLPKLEVLSLHFDIGFTPNLLPVAEMISLKKLEANLMYVDSYIVNQLLQGLAVRNNIETLHLAQLNCTDESIKLLSSMKSLKILKLTETNQLNGNICKRIATGLAGLVEIHIVECKDTSFNEIKEFVVHIPTLRKIVFNRTDDYSPSITQKMFSSLVKTRQNQATKERLLIYLNDNDLREIQNEFKWSGMPKILTDHTNVLKMLPLEKEHRSAVFEYGSGFTESTGRTFFSEMEDENDGFDEYVRLFHFTDVL